jgi:hypothetical protein
MKKGLTHQAFSKSWGQPEQIISEAYCNEEESIKIELSSRVLKVKISP